MSRLFDNGPGSGLWGGGLNGQTGKTVMFITFGVIGLFWLFLLWFGLGLLGAVL